VPTDAVFEAEFRLDKLEPKRQTLSWFTPSGHLTLSITNQNSEEARFFVNGRDKTGRCIFEFQGPDRFAWMARNLELIIPPGETVEVLIRVTPQPRRIIHMGRVAYFCTISVTMLASRHPSKAVLAQVHVKPLIGPGLILLSGAILVFLACLYIWSVTTQTISEDVYRSNSEGGDSISANSVAAMPAGPLLANPAPEAAGMPVAPPNELTYEEIFKLAAAKYDLEWQMLAELAYWESGLNPYAVGRSYEMGLMQIMPATWNHWAPKVGVSNPYDPYSNVLVAAAYLDFLRGYVSDLGYSDEVWILAAYNWGPVNVHRTLRAGGNWNEVPAATRRYANFIVIISETGGVRRVVHEEMKTKVVIDQNVYRLHAGQEGE